MAESLNSALVVLLVGMITVFFILFLVVMMGSVLIRWSNWYAQRDSGTRNTRQYSPSAIEAKHVTAIMTAVEIITNGQGRIRHIQKQEGA